MSVTFEPIRCRFAGTCGFTLVEVLVIVAILSLMAAIVFPSVERALRLQSFVESARRVELGLRSARAMAVGNGVPIQFQTSADRHGFNYGDHRDRLPVSTTIELPDGGITFFADGSATGGQVEVIDGRLDQHLVVEDTLGLVERKR